MATNKLVIEVEALDSGFGYQVNVLGIINDERTRLKEHYNTENATKARLATVWDFWASQVDSE
jgi:hypothetical protein